MTDTDGMVDTMEMVMEMDAHKSWEHKMLDGPWLDFKGDVAHDLGSRTIYFNEAAAMANKAGTAYPVGAMIIKESMDATNTFVSQVSTMMKTDGMMNNGWVYGVSGMPVSAAGDLTMPNQLTAEMGAGCHGCHANATNDFVFVPLSMTDGMADDGMADDGMADDGMADDGMADDDMTDDDMTDDDMTDDDMTDDDMTDDDMTDDDMTDDDMTDDDMTDDDMTDDDMTDDDMTDDDMTDDDMTDDGNAGNGDGA